MNVDSVFATSMTLNMGDTYVRFRFLKENLDLNGNKVNDDLVADIVMSPELFKAIIAMSQEALNSKTAMSQEALDSKHSESV